MADNSKAAWKIFCRLILKGEISRIMYLQMLASHAPLRKESNWW